MSNWTKMRNQLNANKCETIRFLPIISYSHLYASLAHTKRFKTTEQSQCKIKEKERTKQEKKTYKRIESIVICECAVCNLSVCTVAVFLWRPCVQNITQRENGVCDPFEKVIYAIKSFFSAVFFSFFLSSRSSSSRCATQQVGNSFCFC